MEMSVKINAKLKQRRLILSVIATSTVTGALMATGAPATAQDFPTRPVTLVVPYPAGGSADMFGRTVAQAMEPTLKQNVVVENKPGAAGNLGMTQVARSKPDGYTIGLGTIGTQAINPYIYKEMQFDPAKDLVPIALVSTTANVIAVAANSPYKSLQDIINAARASKDKKLSYGTPGIGSSPHLTAANFEAVAGIELLHVPFKGVSQSMPAVAGGQVDLLFDNLPSSINHIKDGSRIRGIAITSLNRDPAAPELPTFNESGLKGFDVTAWFALYAPRNTPQPVLDKLIEAARVGLQSDKIKEAYGKVAATPGKLFGPELAKFEDAERAKWSKLIQDKGIKAQ